jgi:hypothetical protein
MQRAGPAMSGVGCCRTANHWTAAADPWLVAMALALSWPAGSPRRAIQGGRPFLLAALKPLAAPSAVMIEAVS